MNENLLKARDCIDFVVNDLRNAMSSSSAIEAIILLQLIRDAVKIQQDLFSFIDAKKHEQAQ